MFDCLRLLVSCYAVSTAPYMSKESEAFETLLDLLSFDNTASLPVSPAVLALRQVSKELHVSQHFKHLVDESSANCIR